MKAHLFLGLGLFIGLPNHAAVIDASWSTRFINDGLVPDGSGAGWIDSRTFSGLSGTVSSLTLDLNITGGWNGDMYAYLQYDSGFTELINRVGVTAGTPYGNAGSGFNVTFSDAGTAGLQNYMANGTGAITGSWKPTGAGLSSFEGVNPNGTWHLFVADLNRGDVMTVNSWGLHFTTVTASASEGLTAVPEPQQWGFLSGGLLGMFALWKRRRLSEPGVGAPRTKFPAVQRNACGGTMATKLLIWLTGLMWLLLHENLSATSAAWNASPMDSYWQNQLNWSTGMPPGVNTTIFLSGMIDVATFSNSIRNGLGDKTNPIIVDSPRQVKSIAFDASAGAYVIGSSSGNSLLLANAGNISVKAAVSNSQIINAPLAIILPSSTDGTYTFKNDATNAAVTLTISKASHGGSSRSVIFTLDGSNSGTNTVGLFSFPSLTTGKAGILKKGAGTWVLTGSNTTFKAANVMSVNSGLLILQNAAAFGSASSAAVTNNGVLMLDGVSIPQSLLLNGGELRAKGTLTQSSLTAHASTAFTNTLSTTSATDVLTLGNGTNQVSGGVSNSVIQISGPGTVELANQSTYGGRWSVRAGCFKIGASASTPAASSVVVSGGMLAGTGSIGGDVTVANGGVLALGASIGTLSVGSLTLESGSITTMQIGDGLTADKVSSTGAAAYGGVLQLVWTGTTLSAGSVNLFDATSFSGNFSSVVLSNWPSGYRVDTSSLAVDGSVTVATNSAPVAQDLVVGIERGSTLTLQVVGGKRAPFDADGDVLTVTAVGPATAGTSGFTTNSVTYTANGVGDSESFTYTVSDGYGASDTKTVQVRIHDAQGYNRVSSILVDGQAVLGFLGIPGASYCLEVAHSLPADTWTLVQTSIAGTDGHLLFTNTISEAPINDYYRTRYVP